MHQFHLLPLCCLLRQMIAQCPAPLVVAVHVLGPTPAVPVLVPPPAVPGKNSVLLKIFFDYGEKEKGSEATLNEADGPRLISFGSMGVFFR